MGCEGRDRNLAGSSVPAPSAARQVLPHEPMTLADRAELSASTFYETGYWCGESVLKTINELAPDPLAGDVTRLASGFCEGFGGSRCTCGALAGSVMAAGLLTGRRGPRTIGNRSITSQVSCVAVSSPIRTPRPAMPLSRASATWTTLSAGLTARTSWAGAPAGLSRSPRKAAASRPSLLVSPPTRRTATGS